MNTKQVIQASAQVIRITEVKVGDVYKRFDKDYDDRVYFGIIQNIHNDGENSIIESIEYRYSYGSLDVEYKIMRGEKDYILFPSSPDELNFEVEKAKENKLREIESAKKTIETNERIINEIDGLISGDTLKSLKTMSYKEMSQKQYEDKKALI